MRSLALKAKKKSSNEESSTSRSEYEEYAMAVRDFKKFFKRRDAEIQITLSENVRSHQKTKNQMVFVGGPWSDNGEEEEEEEKTKDETCHMAQASNEICLGIDLELEEWIKDSRCTKHMTGNRKLFYTYKAIQWRCNAIFFEHDSEITKDEKIIGEDCRWMCVRYEGFGAVFIGSREADIRA
ncbi:hypothetical protein Tco_0719093 [Tanacetum coccineum]